MIKKIFFFTYPIDLIKTMLYYNNVPVALAGQEPFQ